LQPYSSPSPRIGRGGQGVRADPLPTPGGEGILPYCRFHEMLSNLFVVGKYGGGLSAIRGS
jgi:hypothetical protein